MDQEKRKTIFYRIPLILAAVAAAPNFLLPSNANAINIPFKKVKYFPYEPPNKEILQEIACNYFTPENTNLCYEIPKNNQGLSGTLRFQKNCNETKLTVDIDHKRESRLIILSKNQGVYLELDIDRRKNEAPNPETRSLPISTPLDLIEDFLFFGNFPNKGFGYIAGPNKGKEYRLELKKTGSKDISLEGEVKGEGSKINKLRLNCLGFGTKILPIEFSVEYNFQPIKYLPFYTPIEVRAVLTGNSF